MSTGVAPEHPKSILEFSPRDEIPTWSSKLAPSASSRFFAFRGYPRVGFRMPRRFGCLLFRLRKPKSHYIRSFGEAFWPGRPQLRLLLGRLPVVISLWRFPVVLVLSFCFVQNFGNRASGTCSRCMIIVLSCFSSFKRIWYFHS